MAEVNTKALETYVKRRRQEDKNEVNTVALEAYVKARRPGASYLTPPTTNAGATKAYWVQQANSGAPADGLAILHDLGLALKTGWSEGPQQAIGSVQNAMETGLAWGAKKIIESPLSPQNMMIRMANTLESIGMPTNKYLEQEKEEALALKKLVSEPYTGGEGAKLLQYSNENIEKARGQMLTPHFGSGALDASIEANRMLFGMGMGEFMGRIPGVDTPFSVIAGIEAGGRAAAEAAQAGKDLDTQFLYGAASGALTGAVEGFAGIGASKALNTTAGRWLGQHAPKVLTFLQRAGSTAAGQMALSAGGEAFEEVVQYPLDKVLEWVILDDKSPYDVKEQAYGALMGFALGGLLSAPGSVAGAADARAKYEANATARSAAAEVANRLAEETYESLGLDAPKALDVSSASEQQIKTRMQETYKVIRAQAEVERQQTREALRAVGVNPDIGDLAEGLPAASAPLEQDGTTPATDPRIASMLPGASNITSGLVPNERSAQLPSATASLLDKVGKRIGVRITIGAPTGEMGANGWYGNGEVVIASDAQNPLLVVLKHEITHRLQEAAPNEYKAFRDYAVRQMALRGYSGDPRMAVATYQQRHAQKGRSLTTVGAMDEMAADYTEHLMENPGEFERVVLDDRTVARKIYDAVRQVVASIRAAFTGSARDRAALEQTGRSYAQLQEGLRLWEIALRAAEDVTRTAADLRAQGAEVQTAQSAASMEPAAQFSEQGEIAHIKEQIRSAQDKLNSMDVVAKKNVITRKGMSAAQFKNEIRRQMTSISRKIDVPGIGVVEFGKNEIETGLSYSRTSAEISSLLLVPSVLKRGVDISGHTDHKSRGYSTITIAAPVEINNQRGNMAVVLAKTGKNRYKAHRILAPDGSVFVLFDTKMEQALRTDSGTEPAAGTGTVSDSGRLAANSTVPQEEQTVKGNLPETDTRYSLKDQDSSGGMRDILSRLAQDRAVSEEEIDNVPEIIEARKKVRPGSSADINTPEREALRDLTVDEILGRGSAERVTVDGKAKTEYTGPVKKDRRVDIVIGLPAAGKSSVIVDPLSEQHQSMVLDSDEVKFILPEFENGIGSGYIHEESKEILKSIRDRAVRDGYNIVTPIVGSNVNKVLAEIEQYREAGYDVYLHLNELPANKAIGRALQRFLDTGRFIDPDVLLKYGDKPTEVYERIREMEGVIDGYSRYSNDVKRGEPPILIEQSGTERVRNVQGTVSVPDDGGDAGGLWRGSAGAGTQSSGNNGPARQEASGTVPLTTSTSGAAPLVGARQNKAAGQTPGSLVAPSGDVARVPDLLAGMKTVNEQIGDLLNGLTPVSEQIDALLNGLTPVNEQIDALLMGLTPVETTNENGYPMAHDALYTDSRVYDYDFMVSQPDMKVIHLPDMRAILDKNGQVDRGSIERQGTRETQVTNDYTGRTLQIAPNSTTHSVEGTNKRIVTNGRLGAEAVDLVRHAIPINGLKVQNKNAIGTYAMAALALDDVGNEFVAIITVDQLGKVNNIQFKDIVHSISGRIKRKSLGLTQSHAVRASTHPDTQGFSTISIADFLDIVNSTHQGILSNDVLRHYRAERDMGSYWGSRTQFSLKEGKGEQRNAREVDHIKDQIRRNQDILNTMTSIANSPGYDLSPHDDASRDRILQRLRGYGLRISRQDGITVQLDEDHIRRSWRYVQTREEAEAMMLLPAVIKRGIVLADIEEYKGRPQDSITIGGPVMIGSQRGNMGVVLSRPAGKYFYKATRILSPDGTVFVFGQ